METHPSMPFCTWDAEGARTHRDDTNAPGCGTDLTGASDGVVALWQYRQPQALFTYRAANTSRVSSLRFSLFGVKFGVTDASGHLSLYNFEARQEGVLPYQVRRAARPVGLRPR
jgi:hypothetical protein